MSYLFKNLRRLLRFSPIEKVLFLFTEDRHSDNFFVKIAPGNNLYPSNSTRFVNRKGINYLLDISDYQNWLVYFGVNADRPEGLFELVKGKSVLIDVGANIGQTAMMFAKIAGENATILGFEPDPVNYSSAIVNLNKNKFANIQYYNIGLGSQNETLPLKINTPSNRGGNRMDRNGNPDSIPVTIERLDDVLKKKSISNVDLIKIDVEGFELEVLKGAQHILKHGNPVLFIEISDKNLREQETTPEEVFLFLTSLGYGIVNSITRKPVNEYPDLSGCHFDVICAKQYL